MAKFDESKIINALHIDKAVVGKKYWVSDNLVDLKEDVEVENKSFELLHVEQEHCCPFVVNIDTTEQFQFLYPYEEPSKQRMTNRQLAEWLSKGNGEYMDKHMVSIYFNFTYSKDEENDLVDDDILIRAWDSEEWAEPTTDIFKGSKC